MSNHGDEIVGEDIYEALAHPRDVFDADAEEEARRRYRVALSDVDFVSSDIPMRPPDTTRDRALLRFRRTLYGRRGERSVVLAWGAAAVGIGFTMILGTRPGWADGFSILTLGVLMVAFVVQSGRIGYLIQEGRNDVGNLGAALKIKVVRGHDRVHEVEADIVRRAEEELLTLELWNQRRMPVNSRHFVQVREAISDWINESKAHHLRSAFSATTANWQQCKEMLTRGLGEPNVDQRFFFENPLQMDVTISEKEAILAFPRTSSDRGFALHICSRDVVRDLQDVFTNTVWANNSVESCEVSSRADLEHVRSRVHGGPPAERAVARSRR